MRKMILPAVAIAAGLAQLALAKIHETDHLTVSELEQTLATLHSKPDGKAAQMLLDVELTERLSTVKLGRLESDLPGTKSRQALIAIADASAFFNLPSDEIPTAPPPDGAAQSILLDKARQYVARTIPRLPYFFSSRETTRFKNIPSVAAPIRGDLSGGEQRPVYVPGGQPPRGPTAPEFSAAGEYEPLHFVGASSVTVLYRDRHEFVDVSTAKVKNSEAQGSGLSTAGEFGPILITWLVDSMKGQVTWSHWEKGTTGVQAVFRYAVPQPASHYTVVFPGVTNTTQYVPPIQYVPPYHGEIGVDPADGTILRLTMVADMPQGALLSRSDIAVEYGPVEIGGSTYICPVKSVALSLTRYLSPDALNASSAGLVPNGPMQTEVNDVVFTDYHLFRSEARVLTGDGQEPGGDLSPTSGAPSAAPSTPPKH